MPDRNIKITLQYDGSRYDGWQKQGNTDKTIPVSYTHLTLPTIA